VRVKPEDPAPEKGNVVPIERARKPRKPLPGELTELQVSEKLVKKFGDEIKYCGPLGGWFAWCGTHWRLDDREHARECAKAIARELAAEAAALLDEDTFKAAKRAGSARGVAAILELARSAPGIVFGPEEADRDPWALNCLNGTLDLQNAMLRPHDRADLITRVCPVAYDPSAVAPRFEQFLREILPDAEVRAYVQRFFGYAAAAVVREHVLEVFWGPGANGKSVLADVVTYVLGGYARPGPSSLIVSDGYQPHPTDIASLVGARLVLVHETKRGASFDASKIKLLTGGDKLTARHMREDFFVFEPSHTMLMLSNYRPSADASDAALWRRVQLVPFDVVIPLEKRDQLLAEKLRAEAPGVLRWIVEGALGWQRLAGLAPPAVVLAQTEQYRASEDVIGQFLEERTVRLPQASVKAGALYGAYKSWCEAMGQRPVRGNDFAGELVGRGFTRVERSSGREYQGLGLLADSDDGGRS
jgi:putative DNA primase/helicase